MTELIPISFNKIMQSRAYTVIILGTESKNFAIYTEPKVGIILQMYLTQKPHPRPFTHDLFNNLLKGLGAKILQIVIHDVEDTTYFARLFLEQYLSDKKQILELDARPSDCILLALLNNVPLFCRKEALDKAVAVED